MGKWDNKKKRNLPTSDSSAVQREKRMREPRKRERKLGKVKQQNIVEIRLKYALNSQYGQREKGRGEGEREKEVDDYLQTESAETERLIKGDLFFILFYSFLAVKISRRFLHAPL